MYLKKLLESSNCTRMRVTMNENNVQKHKKIIKIETHFMLVKQKRSIFVAFPLCCWIQLMHYL